MTPILCCWQYGKNFFFDSAIQHGIRRLQGSDGSDLRDALHLRDGKIRYADVSNLPFFFQLRQRLPAFLDFIFGIGPVDLVEIDDVQLQAAQARLQFVADGIALQAAMNLILGLPEFLAPDHRALGKDVGLLLPSFQRPCHHFFRMAKAINRRGIDPVDAKVEGALNRGDRIVVVLRAPAKLPVATADGPGAKTDGGDLQVRIAKLPGCRVYSFRNLHTFFDAVPSVRMRR